MTAREALKACSAEIENPVNQESQDHPENQAMIHNSVHWENQSEFFLFDEAKFAIEADYIDHKRMHSLIMPSLWVRY